MGWRFRRSIRLFPGIRLNIGKRGVSTSIGVRGGHITVGHGKIRETVGIPGSGLNYTHIVCVAVRLNHGVRGDLSQLSPTHTLCVAL